MTGAPILPKSARTAAKDAIAAFAKVNVFRCRDLAMVAAEALSKELGQPVEAVKKSATFYAKNFLTKQRQHANLVDMGPSNYTVRREPVV